MSRWCSNQLSYVPIVLKLCKEARNLPVDLQHDKPESRLFGLDNGLILHVMALECPAHSFGAAMQHKPCGLW